MRSSCPPFCARQREEALLDKQQQEGGTDQNGKRDDYGNLDIPTFLRRQAD